MRKTLVAGPHPNPLPPSETIAKPRHSRGRGNPESTKHAFSPHPGDNHRTFRSQEMYESLTRNHWRSAARVLQWSRRAGEGIVSLCEGDGAVGVFADLASPQPLLLSSAHLPDMWAIGPPPRPAGIPCERAVREPPLRRVPFALRRGGAVGLFAVLVSPQPSLLSSAHLPDMCATGPPLRPGHPLRAGGSRTAPTSFGHFPRTAGATRAPVRPSGWTCRPLKGERFMLA